MFQKDDVSDSGGTRAHRKRSREFIDHSRRKKEFTSCVYEMIDKAPREIVCWSECGDSFVVHDPKRFADETIPSVFKHQNFTSILRRLHDCGFIEVKFKSQSDHV